MRVLALFALTTLCWAQDTTRPPVKVTPSLSGSEMFKTSCAVCHGADAKGGGPAAAALRKAPPDLTMLSKKNHGSFPTQRVRDFIDGKETVAAHGTREMPMWGEEFKALGNDPAAIQYRVVTLATYIESLQIK